MRDGKPDPSSVNSSSTLPAFSPGIILRELASGVILAVVAITYSLSYAVLIFSGPLASGLVAGIGATLLGAGVCAMVVAVGSSLRFAIAGPDNAVMAIVSVMVVSLAADLVAAGAAGSVNATVLTILAGTAVVTGVFLYTVGRLGLGRWIRFIPYTVVGGFLAASGWLLGVGAINLMTGVPVTLENLPRFMEWSLVRQYLPAVAFAMMLVLVLRMWKHYSALPTMLVIGVVGTHALLMAAGMSMNEAKHLGLLLSVPQNAMLWNPWTGDGFALLDPYLIIAHAGELLATIVVTAVAILLNATGLELECRTDADLNRELRIGGIANLLTGLAGGVLGNLSLNRSLLNVRSGSVTRLSGVMVGLLTLLALFAGTGALGYVPKPVLGGTLLFMAFTILSDWVVKTWKRLSLADYLLILAIFATIVRLGYLAGLLLGIGAASMIFAFNYSRIGAVKQNVTGKDLRSNVDWGPEDLKMLLQHGARIHILWLQGFIFFGTSNTLLEGIRRRVLEQSQEPVRWVVLDFRLVHGLDASAVYGFLKLRYFAEERNVGLVVTTLRPEVERALRAEGFLIDADERVVRFPDLDRALEWCEGRLLSEMWQWNTGSDRFGEWLAREMGDERMAARFIDRLEAVEVAAGEALFHQDDPSDAVYFIRSGRVTVLLRSASAEPIRLRSMLGGTVVGEMGFYRNLTRTASVLADEPTLVYRLSRDALACLQRDDSDVAIAFHAMIVRILSDRLALANHEIAALRR